MPANHRPCGPPAIGWPGHPAVKLARPEQDTAPAVPGPTRHPASMTIMTERRGSWRGLVAQSAPSSTPGENAGSTRPAARSVLTPLPDFRAARVDDSTPSKSWGPEPGSPFDYFAFAFFVAVGLVPFAFTRAAWSALV